MVKVTEWEVTEWEEITKACRTVLWIEGIGDMNI